MGKATAAKLSQKSFKNATEKVKLTSQAHSTGKLGGFACGRKRKRERIERRRGEGAKEKGMNQKMTSKIARERFNYYFTM